MTVPPSLFKYKAFNNFLVQGLCDSTVYFSDPNTFNDPLDSRPFLDNDIVIPKKEQLLQKLYEEYRPKGTPSQVLEHLRYMATEHSTGAQANEEYSRLLRSEIEDLFLQHEIGKKGVLSLAERWDCPLMWSHYGDQHQGVCLEYSTQDHVAKNLLKVRYDAGRSIRMSELFDWKVGNMSSARKSILELAYLSKAEAWNYEREWRVLARHPGVKSGPFDLAGIYFGERCLSSIKTMIVKTMHGSLPNLEFYDVHFDSQTFALVKIACDVDYLIQCGVSSSPALIFGRNVSPLPPGVMPAIAVEPDEGEPYLI